jgi:hypothetical protein
METSTIIHEDWELLKKFFPPCWQEKAVELGAIKRCRKVNSPETLLRVLLIHLAEGISFRTTSVYSQEAGLCSIRDTGLTYRMRKAQDWFHWIAKGLLEQLNTKPAPALGFKRFTPRLVDSSMICEPGPTGSQWRLHYCFRLQGLLCDTFEFTTQKEGESFVRYVVEPDDLMMGDRNFCKRNGIVHVLDNKGHVLVRYHSLCLPLFTRNGQEFSLLPHLRSLTVDSIGDWDVWFKHPADGRLIKGRIIAVRKTMEAAEKEKKAIRHDASKKKRETRPETYEYAEYTIVFTTISRHYFSGEELLARYRYRWQIELAFKRLKSIIGIGHIPKSNPENGKAWLYGKMILALLTELVHREAELFSPWGYPFSGTVKDCQE